MKDDDPVEHHFYKTHCLPEIVILFKNVTIYKRRYDESLKMFHLDHVEHKKDIPLNNIEIEALRYWGNIMSKGFCEKEKVEQMVEKSFKANKLITIEEAIKE
jgi:hypothetical protein